MYTRVFLFAIAGTLGQLASAQTGVTVYGVVDAGIVRESGGPQGSVTSLQSGVQSASRLGFKGIEDLGSGLSANFKLETGINVDNGSSTQTGRLFGRHASIGLAGGFGSVDIGRFFNVVTNAMIADPFGAGHEGAYSNIINFALRTQNAVYYTSPTVGGFTGEASYGFGEVPGHSSANRDIGAAIGYAAGPLTVKIAREETENGTGKNKLRISNINTVYDFRFVRVGLAYNVNKDDLIVDSRDWLVGASVPWGLHTLIASYIRHKDRTSAAQHASQIAIGYTYTLSRRTSLYMSHAHIVNKNGALFTVGNMTEYGTGNKGTALGITHRF
ncbi:porin [Massilia sp. METH4]|uniref:porin n=1 Tax=Massilia sp. METH4 TaxID=3123041 RepID=UPI0030CB29A9